MDKKQDLAGQKTPKRVYIAHPIGGDVRGNLKRIADICSQIHSEEIIPIVPYYLSLQYLDDTNAEDRKKGFAKNKMYFARRLIDEVWLCGPRISRGMHEEVVWAIENEIPVSCHNPALESELAIILNEIRRSL